MKVKINIFLIYYFNKIKEIIEIIKILNNLLINLFFLLALLPA